MPETVSVTLTRDSICASDDIYAPHESRVDRPTPGKLSDLCHWLITDAEVPTMPGWRSTWVVCHNTVPLAVITREDTTIRMIRDPMLSSGDAVHLRHRTEENPEAVFRHLVETGHR